MNKGVIIGIVILGLIVIGILVITGTTNTRTQDHNTASETGAREPTVVAPAHSDSEEEMADHEEAMEDDGSKTQEKLQETEEEHSHMIEITSSGYSPQSLTIAQGDSVTFVNKHTRPNWPATNVHPTHTTYPGSDIKKCGSNDAATIFDACKGLAQGETYSFTFTEAGTWPYHDHLRPSATGTITVQ